MLSLFSSFLSIVVMMENTNSGVGNISSLSLCSSPTPSDTTTVSDTNQKSVPAMAGMVTNKEYSSTFQFIFNMFLFSLESVRQCLAALNAASSDTEKLSALFLVPKLVKGSDCDSKARRDLMKVRRN